MLQRLLDMLLQCTDADLAPQELQLATEKQDDEQQGDFAEHHHVVPVLGSLICLARLMEENAQVSHPAGTCMCDHIIPRHGKAFVRHETLELES